MAVIASIVLLALPGVAAADIARPDEPSDREAVDVPGPFRAGRLEVTPILSMRIAGSSVVYRAGMSIAYTFTRNQQVGGMFVMGNRIWDRVTRREVLVDAPVDGVPGGALAMDDGLGASLTGFYRYNIPLAVQKKTYPYIEVFGGQDYWAWGDIREVGGGVGVRKMVSPRTALTTLYAYSVMFADGDHMSRHVVNAGFAVYFR